MAKKKRSDFFDPAADINSRGYRKNLATNGEPDESLMADLLDSSVFFDETDDRAKQSTGSEEDKDLNGHVQIATNVEAKANTSGLEADKTKVVHAGQLPVVSEESSTIGSFTGSTISITVGADATKNDFLAKLSDAFGVWLLNELNTAASGEVNTSSNVGGGVNVFKQKTGVDFEFHSISTISPYLSANLNSDTIEIDFDATSFINDNGLTISVTDGVTTVNDVTSINYDTTEFEVTDGGGGAAQVALKDLIKTLSSVGGGADIYKQTVSEDGQFKSLEQDTGIILTVTADTIQIKTDETYLTNLINTTVGGGVVGDSYLFSASKLEEQVLIDPNIDNVEISFKDDITTGNFDNGNVWTVSQWRADANAVGKNFEFKGSVVMEIIDATGIGTTDTIEAVVTYYDDSTATPTTVETLTFDVPNTMSPGDLISLNLTGVSLDSIHPLGAGNVAENDLVYITLNDASAGGFGGEVKLIPTGTFFYNVEV